MEMDAADPLETHHPSVVAADDDNSDTEMQKKYRTLLSIWLTFSIIGLIWFVMKIIRGRQRLHHNFASIEAQLKRMQAVMEERERLMAASAKQESGQQEASEEKDDKLVMLGTTTEEVEESQRQNTEINGNLSDELDNENEANASRRKIVDSQPPQSQMDKSSVDLIRETIDEIITEGVNEVEPAHSKKDD